MALTLVISYRGTVLKLLTERRKKYKNNSLNFLKKIYSKKLYPKFGEDYIMRFDNSYGR